MNKKLLLMLSLGISFFSLKASSLEERCFLDSFLDSIGASENSSIKMNWADPRITEVERRLKLLEHNQIQQDVFMQQQREELNRQKELIKEQRIEIQELQKSFKKSIESAILQISQQLNMVEENLRNLQINLLVKKMRNKR